MRYGDAVDVELGRIGTWVDPSTTDTATVTSPNMDIASLPSCRPVVGRILGPPARH
jgi:hypothetical protein